MIFTIFEKTIAEMDVTPKIKVVTVPGQGGNKGAKEAAKAKPDGCTMVAVHQSIFTSYFMGRLKFSWEAFDPLVLLTTTPAIVGASAKTPFDDMPELIAAAREKPKSIVTGVSFGSTSHFLLLMIERQADVQFEHFNYNGDTERIEALLNGDIDAEECCRRMVALG